MIESQEVNKVFFFSFENEASNIKLFEHFLWQEIFLHNHVMLSEIDRGKSAQTLYHTEVQKDWFVQRKLFTCVQGCYYLLVQTIWRKLVTEFFL
jgi:hypothetical protein